jgi:lipopolysaccharide export LptBFGC system permease protein LptF
MALVLDYIGSIVIGGIIVMAMLGFYVMVGETAMTQNAGTMSNLNANNMTQILEYDFKKIGYRVADSIKITRADTNQIIFKGDFDDNGTIDSIKYYLGSTKSPNNANPRTRLLYRVQNNQTPRSVDGSVTKFRLWYYDANGVSTSQLKNIRTIKIRVAMQTTLVNDSVNAGVYWERMIRPNNLH